MTFSIIKRLSLGLAAIAAVIVTSQAARAEAKVSTTIESRVLLGLKVDDAAVGAFLPEGWTSLTLPKGPVAGSNLIVSFINRHQVLDPEGKPVDSTANMAVALFAYAVKGGVPGLRGYVIRVYEEPPVVDTYGNSVPTDIQREATFEDAGGGNRALSELWTVRPEAGGELTLDLVSKVGAFGWSKGGESRPYSSVNPDFFRIYRYDQLAALLMNTNLGLKIDGKVSFSSSDPVFAEMFNGQETLVSVISIPTYVRDVWLP